MKRKQFLKMAGAAAAYVTISPIGSCMPEKKTKSGLANWAGNYQYESEAYIFPENTEAFKMELQKLDKAKALGTRHCFNDIADTTGTQLATDKLNQVIELDAENKTVTVGSGIKYGTLGTYLHENGWALHNLASLPHISVAGACATATHGSGIGNGNLASAVRGFELLAANGEVKWYDADNEPNVFQAGVVNLGAFGIITKVKLAIEPTYEVSQLVFEDLPMAELEQNFDAIMGAGYSVSLFTHWLDKNINQVWIKSRVEPGKEPVEIEEFYGAKAATVDLHPIKEISAENCTPQMGVPGPWHERLPHFKMNFMPSAGAELQSEFFVPRKNAYQAIMAIESLHPQISPALLVTEIRTIAADNLWLSTAYKEDMIAIHFTWKQEPDLVMPLLPKIEAALDPFGVKPHWGKLFTLDPEKLRSRYPKFDDFLSIKKQMDPDNKLMNKYLDKLINS